MGLRKYSPGTALAHRAARSRLCVAAQRERLSPAGFAAYCAARAPLDSPRPMLETSPMFRMFVFACAFVFSAGTAMTPALAQQPAAAPAPAAAPMPPYGPAIGLDQAKRVMAAAELEAAKNSWQVAISILDSGGNLVMFHKLDNAQLSAETVSEGKARTALEFKRPSKALDDAIAGGGAGMRLLALKNITPIEGGVLILVDGKIIGTVGVSGALSSQDAQVAAAGAAALAR
jgi:glc operon protein GlcG